jgi:hypothetical protein
MLIVLTALLYHLFVLNVTKVITKLCEMQRGNIYKVRPAGRGALGTNSQLACLQAMPSFEFFGRFLEDANPFAFWVQASRLAWLPWLEAARIALLPFSATPSLPKAGSDVVRDVGS